MAYYQNVREYLKVLEEALHLKSPWYGHGLGHWSEHNREEAVLGLQGKHFEIGKRGAGT